MGSPCWARNIPGLKGPGQDRSPVASLLLYPLWKLLIFPARLSYQYARKLSLQWRRNGHHSVSNHRPLDGLFNHLLSPTSKKHQGSALLALCVGNSPVTGEVPTQRANNAENVHIWWRHHAYKVEIRPPTPAILIPNVTHLIIILHSISYCCIKMKYIFIFHDKYYCGNYVMALMVFMFKNSRPVWNKMDWSLNDKPSKRFEIIKANVALGQWGLCELCEHVSVTSVVQLLGLFCRTLIFIVVSLNPCHFNVICVMQYFVAIISVICHKFLMKQMYHDDYNIQHSWYPFY